MFTNRSQRRVSTSNIPSSTLPASSQSAVKVPATMSSMYNLQQASLASHHSMHPTSVSSAPAVLQQQHPQDLIASQITVSSTPAHLSPQFFLADTLAAATSLVPGILPGLPAHNKASSGKVAFHMAHSNISVRQTFVPSDVCLTSENAALLREVSTFSNGFEDEKVFHLRQVQL